MSTGISTKPDSGPPQAFDEPYPTLFTPLLLGRRRVRNRIAFASLFSGRAAGGDVTPELIHFYANRAKGGAGLIVTEPVGALRHTIGFLAQIGVRGRVELGGLQRLAAAVHRQDSLLLGQLQDSGRGDMRPRRKPFSIAPSTRPDDLSWTIPQAMTVADIDEVRDDFVAAALVLQRAGFDGVELSGGHGHLYHQFLSPWMNGRDDDFGGTRENRVRAIANLVAALRAECGPAFLIGLRLPGDDGLPSSIDWAEAADIASLLTGTGQADYVNFVQGSHAASLAMHVPDLHAPRGVYVEGIAACRRACNGIPVAATGRITEPAQAEALLAAGKADFVMLGRPLLADPAWGLKARQNRDAAIRKCVSGNNCWAEAVAGRPVGCDNNPRVGRVDEVDWQPRRTRAPRRLAVVGAGVAGLEAAWVAAAAGHEVVLFGTSAEAGGKARLYASLPGCEAAHSVIDYQLSEARRAGVDLRLGQEAGTAEIVALAPDAVLLATGGTMLWPPQLPEAWRDWGVIPDLWRLIGELPRIPPSPGTAVVYDFDGSDVVYSAALALADRFARVVLLNPVECLARDEAVVQRQAIYRRLLARGIEALIWSEPAPSTDLERGTVVARNLLTGVETAIPDVALFAYATPRIPRQDLVAPLRAAGHAPRLLGDARLPRAAMITLREAHDLANTLFDENGKDAS